MVYFFYNLPNCESIVGMFNTHIMDSNFPVLNLQPSCTIIATGNGKNVVSVAMRIKFAVVS